MIISHRSLFVLFGAALICFISGVPVLPILAASETPTAANGSQNDPDPEASPDVGFQASELPDAPKPKDQQPSERDQDKIYETHIWWRDVDEPPRGWWHAFRSQGFWLQRVS